MRGFRELDRILRGAGAGAPGSEAGVLAVPLGPLLTVNVILASLYGVCMGFFGVFGRPEPEWRFVVADAIKVPLLFFLTLVVTFPSLYVFNALVGSRLGASDLARLLGAALGVMVAVLAAFGPIVAFFSVTTTSYPFIVLLNVAVFTLAAAFAISFLLRTVDRLTLPPPAPEPVPSAVPVAPPGAEPSGSEVALPPSEEPPAAEVRREPERRPRAMPVTAPPKPDPLVRRVFWGWLVVFALVGAQMSWVLRPFIGTPAKEFAWFRPRQGSFFEGVMTSLRMLFN